MLAMMNCDKYKSWNDMHRIESCYAVRVTYDIDQLLLLVYDYTGFVNNSYEPRELRESSSRYGDSNQGQSHYLLTLLSD
jgi:hypothetical protein